MKLSENAKKILTWVVAIFSIACIVTAIVVPIVIINKRKNEFKYQPDIASKSYNNQTEEYINKNEMSLMFASTPKPEYLGKIRNFMFELISNNVSNPVNAELDISSITRPQIASITSGTTWMFDYQIDNSQEQNLVTYYLATNIHVINLSYTIMYNFASGDQISIQVPINSTTTETVNAYISQPQGFYNNNEQDYFAPISNDPNYYSYFWYQLPNFNVANASKDLIPLGALHEKTASEQSYLGQFTYKNANNQSEQFMLKETNSNSKIEFVPINSTGVAQENSQDFGLLKTTISNPEDIKPSNMDGISGLNIRNADQLEENVKRGFENIQNIFKVSNISFNPENPLDNTYISRLNYLKSLANSNQLTKQKVEQVFMFANMDSQPKNEQISVAGFPGGSDPSGIAYNYYNGATTNKSDISAVDMNVNRDTIQYYYNGQMMSGKYYQLDNYKAPGVNLLPGSSGSMVVNQNGQILGIYWGIVAISNGTNLGMITPIYTTKDSTNLLLKYYQYQKAMNSDNSQATALTSLMNAIASLYK